MSNLALNKQATASSYVAPFTAAKAVDGNRAPLRRWLCDAMPCWLKVDLAAVCGVDRWVVRHMGVVGWQPPAYNMKDYKLQGSMDDANWADLDTVTNNTTGTTDRAIAMTQARYVRVYVTRGLNTNPGVASVVEFEVHGTQSLLSGLVIRAGRNTVPINPVFHPVTFLYSASVANNTPAVTVAPTAQNAGAVIKVNGQPVVSGQSIPVNLNVGQNTITVVVASAGDDQKTYTINVTREG